MKKIEIELNEHEIRWILSSLDQLLNNGHIDKIWELRRKIMIAFLVKYHSLPKDEG